MIEPASDELIAKLSDPSSRENLLPQTWHVEALIARIHQQDADIERLHRGDEKRVRHISQLMTERDEARDEVDRLRAACNQSRLAFAGLVSVQSAIDALDRLDRAALKGGEA